MCGNFLEAFQGTEFPSCPHTTSHHSLVQSAYGALEPKESQPHEQRQPGGFPLALVGSRPHAESFDMRSVVLATQSDFARTLTPNSQRGTDHGWAGHYVLLGGGTGPVGGFATFCKESILRKYNRHISSLSLRRMKESRVTFEIPLELKDCRFK